MIPIILTGLGSLLTLVGTIWASIEQSKDSDNQKAQNDTIAAMQKQLIEKQTEIERITTGFESYTIAHFVIHPFKDTKAKVVVYHKGKYPLKNVRMYIINSSPIIEELEKGNLVSSEQKWDKLLGDFQINGTRDANITVPINSNKTTWYNLCFISDQKTWFQRVMIIPKPTEKDWTSAYYQVYEGIPTNEKILREGDCVDINESLGTQTEVDRLRYYNELNLNWKNRELHYTGNSLKYRAVTLAL